MSIPKIYLIQQPPRSLTPEQTQEETTAAYFSALEEERNSAALRQQQQQQQQQQHLRVLRSRAKEQARLGSPELEPEVEERWDRVNEELSMSLQHRMEDNHNTSK